MLNQTVVLKSDPPVLCQQLISCFQFGAAGSPPVGFLSVAARVCGYCCFTSLCSPGRVRLARRLELRFSSCKSLLLIRTRTLPGLSGNHFHMRSSLFVPCLCAQAYVSGVTKHFQPREDPFLSPHVSLAEPNLNTKKWKEA